MDFTFRHPFRFTASGPPVFGRDCETVETGFTILSQQPVSFSLRIDGTPRQYQVSGTFFYAVSGTVGTTFYKSFTRELGEVINANGGGYSWITEYDRQLGKLVIYTDAGVADVTMSVKTGITPGILGMSGTILFFDGGLIRPGGGGLTACSGSAVPYYVWRSLYPGRQNWLEPYEPQAFQQNLVADDGTVYTFGKESSEILSEWQWPVEYQDKVRQMWANPFEPWTWEHFIKHVRSTIPFLIHTGSTLQNNPNSWPDFAVTTWQNKEGVYKLVGDMSNFHPRPANGPDDPTWWTLPLKTRVVSSGSENGMW